TSDKHFTVLLPLNHYSEVSVQLTNIAFRNNDNQEIHTVSRGFTVSKTNGTGVSNFEQVIKDDTLQLGYPRQYVFKIALNEQILTSGIIPYLSIDIDSTGQKTSKYMFDHYVDVVLYDVPFKYEPDGTISIVIPGNHLSEYRPKGRM